MEIKSHISVLLLMVVVSGSGGLTLETAVASWYGEYHFGRLTANGEVFDSECLTFAHKEMKFGTLVEFYYKGKTVIARCNDRGPYIKGREFDLSYQTAKKLGFLEIGVDEIYYKEEVRNDFQRNTNFNNFMFRDFLRP